MRLGYFQLRRIAVNFSVMGALPQTLETGHFSGVRPDGPSASSDLDFPATDPAKTLPIAHRVDRNAQFPRQVAQPVFVLFQYARIGIGPRTSCRHAQSREQGAHPGRLHHPAYDAGLCVDAKTAQSLLTSSNKSAVEADMAVRIDDFWVPNQDRKVPTHPPTSWAL